MKWQIPAKTFLLGEYVALAGGPAFLLGTEPCFEMSITSERSIEGIHPESPAGRWWMQLAHQQGLKWKDPYHGMGGLGASSAQFVGAYLADQYLKQQLPNQKDLLEHYLNYAWQGIGVPPSGYDVLAQSMQGCVYLNQQNKICQSYDWPFADLAFVLIHMGKKLATHHHLETVMLPNAAQLDGLATLVESAKVAFEDANSEQIINAINAYHHQLSQLNLVADHSRQLIASLQQCPQVRAVKGCGAMGADILLVLVNKSKLNDVVELIHARAMNGLHIVANSESLYIKKALIENNP